MDLHPASSYTHWLERQLESLDATLEQATMREGFNRGREEPHHTLLRRLEYDRDLQYSEQTHQSIGGYDEIEHLLHQKQQLQHQLQTALSSLEVVLMHLYSNSRKLC